MAGRTFVPRLDSRLLRFAAGSGIRIGDGSDGLPVFTPAAPGYRQSPGDRACCSVLFRRLLLRDTAPCGAASLAARHSELPRSSPRYPERFRFLTPLTTGERRSVSIRAALPPSGSVSRPPLGVRWPAASGSASRVTVDCSSAPQRCSSPTPMCLPDRRSCSAFRPRASIHPVSHHFHCPCFRSARCRVATASIDLPHAGIQGF